MIHSAGYSPLIGASSEFQEENPSLGTGTAGWNSIKEEASEWAIFHIYIMIQEFRCIVYQN